MSAEEDRRQFGDWQDFGPEEAVRMALWRQLLEPALVAVAGMALTRGQVSTVALLMVSLVVMGRVARHRTQGVPGLVRWWTPLIAVAAAAIGLWAGLSSREVAPWAAAVGGVPVLGWLVVWFRDCLGSRTRAATLRHH